MKKYVITTCILSLIALFSVACIVNASGSISEEEVNAAVNSLITFRSEEFLSSVNSSKNITSIEEAKNSLTKESFYRVETENSILNLDYSTKEVTGFYEKQASYLENSTATKEDAKSFVKSKYADLNLPTEYDLVYLEKVDDCVWEADFQKKYNDAYNMYEAVKLFFIPENKEIVALTVFNEEYKDTSTKITNDEAKNIADENLNLDSEIVSSELTIIKGNDYFGETPDNKLHKAWVLTTNDNEYVYVDSASGEIIGGDIINE